MEISELPLNVVFVIFRQSDIHRPNRKNRLPGNTSCKNGTEAHHGDVSTGISL